MITIKELERMTGFNSFLNFYRKVTHSTWSAILNGDTKYYFQEGELMKEVDLNITIEELKKMADEEKGKFI